MTTCLIIEDDLNARDSLSTMIKGNYSKKLNLLGVAHSVKEGCELIKKLSPELIFLNIELPDENGFNLFNYFPTFNFDVIFTTNSPDYAISAIKHMAIDYLIKPVDMMDLGAALVRFEKRRNISGLVQDTFAKLVEKFKLGISFDEKIALPTADGFQVEALNEILYCQASENYTVIHTVSDGKILITKTLKTLEEMLPSCSFFRIHKSVLININYVKCFSRKEGFIVTLETGQKFEVANRRHEIFINHLMRRDTV